MENGKYTKVKDSDFEAKNEVPIPSKIGIGTASKPPDRTFCESIRIFFYNSENGSFCSRTPKSWSQILLFFLCFYAVLFGLWASWMYAFLMSLPETASGPKYMLEGSLLGTNPGVGLKPGNDMRELQSKPNIRQSFTLHRLASSYDTEIKHRNKEYADRLKLFLDQYSITSNDRSTEYQKFPLETLGDCWKYPYGYLDDLEPCFILSLNRIWNWQPVAISNEDFEENDWPIQFEEHCTATVIGDCRVIKTLFGLIVIFVIVRKETAALSRMKILVTLSIFLPIVAFLPDIFLLKESVI